MPSSHQIPDFVVAKHRGYMLSFTEVPRNKNDFPCFSSSCSSFLGDSSRDMYIPYRWRSSVFLTQKQAVQVQGGPPTSYKWSYNPYK